MARKRRSGLRKRGDYWHIEKLINGQRVYESTGETNFRRAEAYYDNRIKAIREAVIDGPRPEVRFKEAAEKFLREDCPTKSLERAGYAFDKVLPYIGDLPIERVHEGSLADFKRARQDAGVSVGTINKELMFVTRVLTTGGAKMAIPERNAVPLHGPFDRETQGTGTETVSLGMARAGAIVRRTAGTPGAHGALCSEYRASIE